MRTTRSPGRQSARFARLNATAAALALSALGIAAQTQSTPNGQETSVSQASLAEWKGLAAQFSIHRGRQQQILFDAVVARMGESAVRTGQRVSGFVPMPVGARMQVAERHGALDTIEADLLIGPDGIRSAVRQSVDPALGALATNGWVTNL